MALVVVVVIKTFVTLIIIIIHHHCHPHPHHHYLQDLVCGGRGHRGVKHDAVAEDWGETDTKLSDTSHIYATNRMHRKHHIHQR